MDNETLKLKSAMEWGRLKASRRGIKDPALNEAFAEVFCEEICKGHRETYAVLAAEGCYAARATHKAAKNEG